MRSISKRLEILLLVGLEVQHDLGAARHARRLLLARRRDLEAGAARRSARPRPRSLPARRLVDLDAVRHHEGRIEADAELADQAAAVLGLGQARS